MAGFAVFGWVPVEKIWSENVERKSMPPSILSLHHDIYLSSSQAGMLLHFLIQHLIFHYYILI